MNPFYKAVGTRMRTVREGAGMSQSELADAAGINRSYLSRAEGGLQNISLMTLGRAAVAMSVDPAVFFEGVSVSGMKFETPERSNSRKRPASVKGTKAG